MRSAIPWMCAAIVACGSGSPDDQSLYACSPTDVPEDGAGLLVTAPNGGELVVGGDRLDIAWTDDDSDPAGTVDVDLLRDGQPVLAIATGAPNTGSLAWTVPVDLAPGDAYAVRVRSSDGQRDDRSDAAFDIGNWAFRRAVSISSPTARADYPVLVELAPGDPAFDAAAPAGTDLRFAGDPDRRGGFDVPHYVDTWDDDGARVWIRVPEIAPGEGAATVYMFYGAPTAQGVAAVDDTSDPDAVFVAQLVTDGDIELAGVVELERMVVSTGDTVRVTPGSALEVHAHQVVVRGNIDATGAGFPGGIGDTPGEGPGGGGGSHDSGAGGGGHGGVGGEGGFDDGDVPGAGGPRTGTDIGQDIALGSGGGGTNVAEGGAGGGAVIVIAHSIAVEGTIAADGATGGIADEPNRGGGGGAGGGVLFIADDVAVSGRVSASGGGGGAGLLARHDGGGGGGGGRIKVFHADELDITGTLAVDGGKGGFGGGIDSGDDGEGGYVHIEPIVPMDPVAVAAEPERLF